MKFKYGSIDGTVELSLEPFLSVFPGDSLGSTQAGTASLPQAHSSACTSQDDVEVHTEDTGVWVVFHAQINVFLNTKAEVASIGEVLLLEFLVLDLEASFEDLLSLITTDGHVHCHLFISLDTKASDGESGSGVNGLLS
jgi:hypothetical protein